MPSEKDPLVAGNNGAAADSNNDHEKSPLYQLEQRRRNRLFISLAVVTLVCAMMGSLLVWRLHVSNMERRAQLPAKVAAQALDRLNHHIAKQSRHVEKLCESTILLTRHCEKEGPYTTDAKDETEHCSYIGYERASHLASLFGPDARWPTPSHLFALTPARRGDHLNFREWETLKPLSDQSAVVTEIQSRMSLPKQYFELLQSGDLCGKVVVVSWKHEFIPELARNLGCGPKNGCPNAYPEESFDQVWQLKFVFHPEQPPLKDEHKLKKHTNFTAFDEGEEVDDDEYVNDPDGNDGGRRLLLRERSLKKGFSNHGWNVYATVNYQNFDPLAYSKQIGDYPEEGSPKGGSWNDGGL